MPSGLFGALVAVIVSVVTTVGSVGFLTVRAQRRKIDADAEVTLSDGSLRRVKAAEDSAALATSRADSLQGAVDGLRLELERSRRRQFAYETWAAAHQVWDAELAAELTERGGHPKPPPLLVFMDDNSRTTKGTDA